MKIADLFNLAEGLGDLLDKELPVKTALTVRRNHKKVDEEIQSPQEIVKKLLGKYRDYDKENGITVLKEEHAEDFHNARNELFEEEVDIELKKIHVDELKDVTVKPRTLALLDTILKYD